jgi:hypothetical protein
MRSAAVELAAGIMLGLYNCRHGNSETLLEYCPDYAAEHASDVMSDCARLGIELPTIELLDLMPEWSAMLHWALDQPAPALPGRIPRRPPRGSAMAYPNDERQRKGATLSDKTAQEFGLTQDEIYDAIDAGTLQYRQAYMHGNPWLRLLRREVETLPRARHGDRYVSEQQARAELTRVDREIRRLRTELAELEERRAKLGSDLGE